MNQINLLLPNQLFKNSPLFNNNFPCYLVEEYLFFKQYPFHKQKIAFHRTTMKKYADFLTKEMNFDVHYIESIDPFHYPLKTGPTEREKHQMRTQEQQPYKRLFDL